MEADIDRALELLIGYWRAPGEAGPTLAFQCRQVADALFHKLAALNSEVQRSPDAHRETIRSALQQLVQQGPTQRALVRQLVHQAPTAPVQVNVSGSGNVTLAGTFTTGDIHVGDRVLVEPLRSPHKALDEDLIADLELWLQPHGDGLYRVVMSFTPGGSTAVEQPLVGRVLAAISLARLNELINDPEEYGNLLTSMLCADPQVAASISATLHRTRGAGAPLRLRLRLEGDDPLLTAVRWELLRAPTGDRFLFPDAGVWFSRLPTSSDQARVGISSAGRLHAVVAVAAPADLPTFRLAPIDGPAELELAQRALGDTQVTSIIDASLEKLAAALLDELDVLYLVAHGAIKEGQPVLYLVGPNGRTAPTPAQELVSRMQSSSHRPALIVLASCQSAGQSHGEGTGLAALGPSFARAGVGAVLAMQDNIPIEAVHASMPVLWKELHAHGTVDRAVASMRNVLAAGNYQWWQPILYLRLRDGRIFRR